MFPLCSGLPLAADQGWAHWWQVMHALISPVAQSLQRLLCSYFGGQAVFSPFTQWHPPEWLSTQILGPCTDTGAVGAVNTGGSPLSSFLSPIPSWWLPPLNTINCFCHVSIWFPISILSPAWTQMNSPLIPTHQKQLPLPVASVDELEDS